MPNRWRIQRYGWKPDHPDPRDRYFRAPVHVLQQLPPAVDLRPGMPAVYDQGDLGSCTANAIAAAIQFDRLKANETPDFVPSRLFIYFNERTIEGTPDDDSGAELRDGIKSVAQFGVCPETQWPYDVAAFTHTPPLDVCDVARQYLVTEYKRIPQSLFQMKAVLAAGYPFVFGFTVFDSLESDDVAQGGVVPMPDVVNENPVGGHAVLAVGYDDDGSITGHAKHFIVRNSWSADWGIKGYMLMPYNYLLNGDLADDFWQVNAVAK